MVEKFFWILFMVQRYEKFLREDIILKKRGLSQKEFAHLMGKTEPEVSRWVGGTHNLTIRALAKISVVLGEDVIKV